MRISELIELLEKRKEDSGDLPVFCVEGIYDWEEKPVGIEETTVELVKKYDPKPEMEIGDSYLIIDACSD